MRRIKQISVLALSLMLVACAQQDLKPEQVLANNSYFSVVDQRLGARLKLEALAKTHAGNLQVIQAQISNHWHANVELEYQVIWKNAQGFTVDAESAPWIPQSLTPGESFSINSTAPNANANQFKIYLKAP